MADTALQRKNMVESQVRPSDVTDRRVTAAMQALAREAFVPDAVRPLAYMDEAIEVAPGRAMLAPRVLARLVQLADIAAGDRVLVISGLRGYTAALISALAGSVVALECDATLAAEARKSLGSLEIRNVEFIEGALEGGHLPKAPYDVIFIEGEIEDVPETLRAQLGQGGRLVAIQARPKSIGEAFVLLKSGTLVSRRDAFEASGALLAPFTRPKGFEF